MNAPLRLCFVVNAIDDLVVTMTTFMLVRRAVAAGHTVHVTGVDDLGVARDGRLIAKACTIEAGSLGAEALTVAALRDTEVGWIELDLIDALLMRTNPARDAQGAHETALALARVARDRGVVVLNDPDGLIRASSKLYLMQLDERYRPVTEVSRDVDRLLAFINGAPGRCVLKPLAGTRGRDVFVVEPGGQNLRQIAEVVTREGYGMAQHFVPEATQGDVRVVVMDGNVLEVDGKSLAVARVPHETDFRSNIHAGGHAEPGEVTDAMREAIAAAAPFLARDGIFLSGLDFIGTRIVEINVYATGGFRDAERYYERDFTGAVLDAITVKVEAARRDAS
ncbi:MAG: hypothetical protein KC503_25910 [Myxococcales bacterium]|nr:hypothetical protein [Myxococcales bacterium]